MDRQRAERATGAPLGAGSGQRPIRQPFLDLVLNLDRALDRVDHSDEMYRLVVCERLAVACIQPLVEHWVSTDVKPPDLSGHVRKDLDTAVRAAV